MQCSPNYRSCLLTTSVPASAEDEQNVSSFKDYSPQSDASASGKGQSEPSGNQETKSDNADTPSKDAGTAFYVSKCRKSLRLVHGKSDKLLRAWEQFAQPGCKMRWPRAQPATLIGHRHMQTVVRSPAPSSEKFLGYDLLLRMMPGYGAAVHKKRVARAVPATLKKLLDSTIAHGLQAQASKPSILAGKPMACTVWALQLGTSCSSTSLQRGTSPLLGLWGW